MDEILSENSENSENSMKGSIDTVFESNNSITMRSNLINKKKLFKDLEKLLKLDYKKKIFALNTPLIIVNRNRIFEIAQFFKSRLYKLENLFASDIQKSQSFEINYTFHLRPYLNNSSIIIQTKIKKGLEIETISEIFSNALSYEQNIFNRLGLKFLHITGEKKSIDGKKSVYCIPYKIDVRKEGNIKINGNNGVFHPIHNKKNYFCLNVSNGLIKDIELRDGWFYKKIQPKLENSNPFSEFTDIFNRLSHFSSYHLNLCYILSLERILDISPPIKVKYIRIFIAELERLESHLQWFVNLAILMNYKISNKFHYFLKKIQLKFIHYFKKSNLSETLMLGSTTDISMDNARSFYHFFRDDGFNFFEDLKKFVYKTKVRNRLSNIGYISAKNALKIGLTGPSLRGSGIQSDIRINNPYLNYTKGEISQIWNVISFKNGGIYSRTQVRLWEFNESIKICTNILHSLANYQRKIKNLKIPDDFVLKRNKKYYFSVESPQGLLSMYLRTHNYKDNKFHTVRILTPDYSNYNSLNEGILLDSNLKDFPLIIHSFDLNFKMIDL